MFLLNRYTPALLLALALISCGQSENKATPSMAITNEAKTAPSTTFETTKMKKTGAYLEISLKITEDNRPKAAGVYSKYKSPFLDQIEGATSKDLLLRGEDVQVLHGFETAAQANAYLTSSLFSTDIVGELGPLLAADPEVRIYTAAAPALSAPATTGAFLEISLKVDQGNRASAGAVYSKYKQPFLSQIDGASSKELIMRDEDVQVLHGFETEAQAQAYLQTNLFSKDIVGELGPLLAADPEVRIYTVFK